MSRKPTTIGYDQFFQKPVKERITIFNEISAENRASLVKAQAERWLAANKARLSPDQLAVVEEVIQSISRSWYERRPGFAEVEPKVEALIHKLETVLSQEDVRQFATERAEYIPPLEDNLH